MSLSICFIGCGEYAKDVLDQIDAGKPGDLAVSGIELYFASRDAAKAEQFCKQYGGAGFFGSYEEAAASEKVDALYFLTPHHLHLEGAQLAAKHGKQVLMEKPIGRYPDEARELIETVRAAGLTLMIAENFRFVPTVLKAKELIADGTIGDVRLVQVQRELDVFTGGVFGSADNFAADEWRNDPEKAGGGLFQDGGIHDVDAMVNLGGMPKTVYAVVPAGDSERAERHQEDGMVLTGTTAEGTIGLIQFSFATPIQGYRDNVWVTGSAGMLSFATFGTEVTVDTPQGTTVIDTGPHRKGMAGIFEEFRDAVAEGREPLMSGLEALNDLNVVMAAYESVKTGQAAVVSAD
jgi:UDP-N-acetylglucosamine 3-dehydrogenase